MTEMVRDRHQDNARRPGVTKIGHAAPCHSTGGSHRRAIHHPESDDKVEDIIDKRFALPALARLPSTSEAYLVGGTVRDLLLGRPPADLDIAVAADPAGYARSVALASGHRVVTMGKPGQDVFRVAAGDTIVDVTALKTGGIEADLEARDFTVNAMAWNLRARNLVDPLGGRDDLGARRIRMASPDAFENDPLRLLRAYRMAASLGFDIDQQTRDAIRQASGLIAKPAGERIRVELLQLLAAPDAMRLIRMMAADRLLTALFPEIQAMAGCWQNAHHDFDVFEHTLKAFEALEALIQSAGCVDPALAARYRDDPTAAAVLKYALLLHDIGKPASQSVEPDGRVRFLGHAEYSAQMAAAINERLRLSRREAQQAESVIRLHVRPLDLFAADGRRNLNPRAIHRFFRSGAPWSVDILVHALADRRGKRSTPTAEDDAFEAFVTELIRYYYGTYGPALSAAPLLSGRDLMRQFDLAPGPVIGELLGQIEEERLAGSLTTREDALEFARRKLKSARP